MKARLNTLGEQLRASFWFIPVLMLLGALLLAIALLTLDAHIPDADIAQYSWIYTGGPDGARSLLSTIASSVIGVAGTIFSITIAALTLASSQFGPRLLRTFVRDRGNQVVLGTFIATFLYCLLVLRTIRGLEDTRVVPHLSVTVGVGLAIASLGVLIYFIHHVATSIQADHVIATVSDDASATIERLFPETIGQNSDEVDVADAPASIPAAFDTTACTVPATAGGYLQALDDDGLMQLAIEHDLVLELAVRPGDFIVKGNLLARAWPPGHVDDAVRDALNAACILGLQRTAQQDLAFAIDQIVEIGVRALSPGVNDPFTAITCIDRLSTVLSQLADRAMPSRYRFDDDGQLRVIAPEIVYAHFVVVAFDKLRLYSASSKAVTLRLLHAIGTIAVHTRTEEQRHALRRQLAMIVRGSETGLPEAEDRVDVAVCAEHARTQCDQATTPSTAT